MKAKRFLLAMFAILTCIQAWSEKIGDRIDILIDEDKYIYMIYSITSVS